MNFFVNDSEVLTKLRNQLNQKGFQIFAISESRPSLDEVYLKSAGKTLLDAELEVANTRDLKKEAKQAMR